MVGLFECTVPEQDCNIHLGSRRKSRVVPISSRAREFTREELPAHVSAWALKSLQAGRPDRLLQKDVHEAVGKICAEVTDELLATDKERFPRTDVYQHCSRALDKCSVPIPIHPRNVRFLESFTAQCLGTCDDQEDRSVRVPDLSAFVCGGSVDREKDEEVDYCIGVFDGHAGSECSEFSHDRLFYEVGKQGFNSDVESILRKAYSVTDTAFAKKADEEELKAGCTALMCLVRGDMLWVANVGDSRGILCSKHSHKVLTTDHNVKNKDEVADVLKRGGTILRNRVNGVLCVTRALGNRTCRDLISQTPDIASYVIDWDDDMFLVIGSDGLYDHTTNEEVCQYIMESKNAIDAELAALRASHPITATPSPTPVPLQVAMQYLKCTYQRCADEVIKRVSSKRTGYCDNTTVVILFLDTKQCVNSVELYECARVLNESNTQLEGSMSLNASTSLRASLPLPNDGPPPGLAEACDPSAEASMLASMIGAPGDFLGSPGAGGGSGGDFTNDALEDGCDDGFDMMASSVMGRPPV